MHKLSDDLEVLYQLRDLRERALDLATRGSAALNGIGAIDEKGNVTPRDRENGNPYKHWLGMGNRVEAALLLKSRTREESESYDCEFLKRIRNLTLPELFPVAEEPATTSEMQSNAALDHRVPVLVAALSLQVLAGRSETALSETAILCYYRILLEITVAARPDWTIGAARAGDGGSISVFVTGECIRAILSLERAFKKSVEFFDRTRELYDQYYVLEQMIKSAGSKPDHPVRLWTEKVIERLWLDWYVSTEPIRRELAFDLDDNPLPEMTHTDSEQARPRATLRWVGNYLENLPSKLQQATEAARTAIENAQRQIAEFHDRQPPADAIVMPPRQRPRNRLAAQEFAIDVIEIAYAEAARAEESCRLLNDDLPALLKELSAQFTVVQRNIRRLLDPSRRYVEGVLDRELAAASGELDAGELVFAASSLGALTGWGRSHLMRACKVLIENLPVNGLMTTKHPFHSTRRGYKLFPTGCDMFRSLALLLERTAYEFDPSAIAMFLDTIEEKVIGDDHVIGWNFEGATETEKPSTWVTAVAVATLERVVVTLDARINSIVLHHFDVPTLPHASLNLGDLIYPDYGFSVYYDGRDGPGNSTSVGIRLQQMRAHLTHVPLPQLTETGEREDIFAAVLYGPPQTGKTTLAEALAMSSNVPLVRLSPFDLTLESHQSIEGRTRLVFEALSMLTRVVILFDEFESVLQRRKEDEADDDDLPQAARGAGTTAESSSSPTTQFLLTGLLPQLVKLHAVARRKSIVYFLATNRLKRIDDAAIRRGRFDLWIPIYNPDPLSRAGTFLYRLQRLVERGQAPKGWRLDAEAALRLLEIVMLYADVPASTLADVVFRLPQWISLNQKMPADARAGRFFRYVFSNTDREFDQARKDFSLTPHEASLLRRRPIASTPAWADEPRERAWLKSVENDLITNVDHESDKRAGVTAEEIFRRCLRPATTLNMTGSARTK